MSAPHLYQCLTREEFKLCWALRMTLGFESFDDAYPLDSHPSPGAPDIADTYDEQMKRAIRFLALDHGFNFAGLTVHEDGSIHGGMIEPRNMTYVRNIALYVRTGGELGVMPHPISAAKTAIRILEEQCPALSTEPLHQLIRELELAIDEMPDPEPEAEAEIAREKNAALATIGMTPREVH